MPVQQSNARLNYLCDVIPGLLAAISETEFLKQPAHDKWSKKQILGHLIDSTTCNHQRFIRAQFEHIPTIVYDQNNWNSYSHYQKLDSSQLILFWTVYNRHLLALMDNISLENLQCKCNTGGTENHTIEWLYHDYLLHLEHHLKQIVIYEDQ